MSGKRCHKIAQPTAVGQAKVDAHKAGCRPHVVHGGQGCYFAVLAINPLFMKFERRCVFHAYATAHPEYRQQASLALPRHVASVLG